VLEITKIMIQRFNKNDKAYFIEKTETKENCNLFLFANFPKFGKRSLLKNV